MKKYLKILFAAMFILFVCQGNVQAQKAKVLPGKEKNSVVMQKATTEKGKTTVEKGKATNEKEKGKNEKVKSVLSSAKSFLKDPNAAKGNAKNSAKNNVTDSKAVKDAKSKTKVTKTEDESNW